MCCLLISLPAPTPHRSWLARHDSRSKTVIPDILASPIERHGWLSTPAVCAKPHELGRLGLQNEHENENDTTVSSVRSPGHWW